MPRFSIRQLLIATAVAAVGCVALLNASPIWSASLMSGMAVILTAAVLLAIFRDGERRAYWIGFALCGWEYLLLCFGGIFAESSNPFGWTRIATGRLATALYDRIHSSDGKPEAVQRYVTIQPSAGNLLPTTFLSVTTGNPQTVSTGPDRTDFLYVAHALWTLLLAVSGGWFACWLFATRAPREQA